MKPALLLLLIGLTCHAARMVVATVGDSFADSLYLAMKVRPDLLKKHEIELQRWSRGNIGFTRLDYFDYPGWLRDTQSLGRADLCLVHIGANDQQSIRTGGNRWAAFGGADWLKIYQERVAGMLETLQTSRCRHVLWILPPRFEGNARMAKGIISVRHGQSAVLQKKAAVATYEMRTTTADYGIDNIHYGRDAMLRVGPVLVRIADAVRRGKNANCQACHNSVKPFLADVSPLRPFVPPPVKPALPSSSGGGAQE